MSLCPQCGAENNPHDKFCNSCGFALAQAGGAPGAGGGPGAAQPFGGGGYGPPPGGGGGGQAFGAPPGGGAPQPARCQQGHEIQPGASYCAMGHPIALDAMQFQSDQYGAPPPQPFGAPAPGGYGQPAPAPYGAPAPGGYGQPAPGGSPFGAQPGPAPSPFGAPAQGGYGQPAPSPFGAPPPGGGYGAPGAPPGPAPGGPGGFGGGAPGGFGAPAPAPGGGGFGGGAPAPSPFGAPAPAPGGGFGGGGPGPAANYPDMVGTSPSAGGAPGPLGKVLRGFLVSFQTNKQGDFWPLHGGRVTVGRANAGEGVDIPLADATISSRHAAVLVDNATGGITVEDTGSTNGTYVNDEHIGMNGRRELRDGDRLRFGGFTTIVKVIGPV